MSKGYIEIADCNGHRVLITVASICHVCENLNGLAVIYLTNGETSHASNEDYDAVITKIKDAL